jgi:hypothetical protein
LQERNAEITKRMQMLENQSRGSNGSKAGTDDKDRQDAYVSLKQSSESLADNKTELAKVEAALKQQLEAWKTSRNHDHIRRLVRAIEDEAAHKREIMLELVDVSNNPVNQHRERGSNRASRTAPRVNEDLVRQNIDYLLTRKLMDNSANMSNVEWFNAPSGSHSGLTEADIAATKESWEIQITKKPLAELRSSLLEKEIARIKTIKARFSATDNKIFNELFAEIAQIAQKGDLKEEQQLYEHKLNDFLTMLQEVRQVGELKGLDGWNTRIVAVSVRSVSDKHSFIPLSLMDYVYFTIYTITTTGYGDIVPTTTYAKFLCSFANILEVFFLVVFFNALLSAVKRSE